MSHVYKLCSQLPFYGLLVRNYNHFKDLLMYKRICLGVQRLRPNGEISVEKKLCSILYTGGNKGSHYRPILLYSVGVLYLLSNHNKQLKK